jgi:hypothetical protein
MRFKKLLKLLTSNVCAAQHSEKDPIFLPQKIYKLYKKKVTTFKSFSRVCDIQLLFVLSVCILSIRKNKTWLIIQPVTQPTIFYVIETI